MLIDPAKNSVPWSHKLRVGSVVVDLLAPHQAAAIDLPAGGAVSAEQLRGAVEGLVAPEARPLIASLPASHLVDVLRQYEACAEVWRQTRAEIASALATQETVAALTPPPAPGPRKRAPNTEDAEKGRSDERGEVGDESDVAGTIEASPGAARSGTHRVELEISPEPGAPLPQPLAELARETEARQAAIEASRD